MPNFNPKFTFGRRASRDVSSGRTNNDERQPLLPPQISNGHIERNIEPPAIETGDFKFLSEEWKQNLAIYANIHRIRREIIMNIDDPCSHEQLRGNRLNKTVVRPLADKFYDPKDISTVFCLMVNRVQFAKEETTARHQSISHSRGILCELVAIKILRRFTEEYHGPQGLLVLAHILVSGFDTFQNAPLEIAEEHSKAHLWAEQGKIESDRKLTALEISIISESKNLLSTRPCQRVIDAIYRGTIVYTPTAFFEFLPDTYKFKSIGLYNAQEAPILDQYRLVVPRNRYYLEILHFVILLGLYVAQMEMRDSDNFTTFEIVFCIYTYGWLLDQCATILEHGWQVYTQNLWTYLDVSFGATFMLYFILRVFGHHTNNPQITEIAFDLLAMGAPFLVPRLAFNILSENMLFVSLREMMSNFVLLTLLAVWSFGGFLLASTWMSRGDHSPWIIAKWMLWLWFGLDATGIEASPSFHWLLGPVLMISFAFLGNTLFLTILVSMLSNTFATIAANTDAEIQYRRTVITFEGVKADSLFSYPPPFNILALIILLPLKTVLTPRYFHKVIVYSVRTINFPILLWLSFFERRNAGALNLPNWWRDFHKRWQWDNLGLAVHGDLHTVFERAPPRSIYGSVDLGPLNDQHHLAVPNLNHLHPDPLLDAMRKDSMNIFLSGIRKESVGPYHEVTEQLHELFQEHGGGKENQERFANIESSIVRMESIFGMFCERLDSIDASAQPVSRQGSSVLDLLARRASTDFGARRGSKVVDDTNDEQLSNLRPRRSKVYGTDSDEAPTGDTGRRGSQAPGSNKDDGPFRPSGRRSAFLAVDDDEGPDGHRRNSQAFNSHTDDEPSSTVRRGSQQYPPPIIEDADARRGSQALGLNVDTPADLMRRRSEIYGPDDIVDAVTNPERRGSRVPGSEETRFPSDHGDRRRGSSTVAIEDDEIDEGTANLRRSSQAFGPSRRRERESFVHDSDDEICPIDTRGMRRGSEAPDDRARR